MNASREEYLVVSNLPFDVTMKFGKSGSPAAKLLRPQFRRLGRDCPIACNLEVVDWTPKQIKVRLPESLACQGEGRYELVLHENQCTICDTVEIWFEADCTITQVRGEEMEEKCDDC